VVLNSLNFRLSENFLFLHQFWMRSLPGIVILVVDFSPSSSLNISCHYLLGCRVSAERSALKHIGFPLYVTCCFSLAAFNILSLSLLVWLVCVLACFSLGLSCMGLCASWTWLTISFFKLGEFSTIISSKFFSYPFFFYSSSGTPINQMLVNLILF